MVYITKMGSFLPGNPIDNDTIEEVLGLVHNTPSKAKRIVLRSNGIKNRYYALDPETRKPTHNNAQITAMAIENCLKGTEFEREEPIELLACGTTCPDQFLPAHASMVQGELRRNPCEVISTSGVCCSSISALKYAYLSVLSGDKKSAIATGSEISSKFMRAENFEAESEKNLESLDKNKVFQFEQDFLRWMLSDGAGAFLLENKPRQNSTSLKIEWIDFISYANELPTCMYGGSKVDEDGNLTSWLDIERQELLNSKALNISQDTKLLDKNMGPCTVSLPFPEIKRKRELSPENINWFVPHYSSDFFRKKLYQHLKDQDFEIPYEKWSTSIVDKGNIGSASIYIYLQDLLESDQLKDGDKVLCFIPESSRFSVAYMMLTVSKNYES